MCQTNILSAQIHFKNTLYIICPGHFDRRSVVKYNNDIGLDLEDLFYEGVLAFRQTHVLPVVAFAFKIVRKSCKYHSHIALFCSIYSFGQKCSVDFVFLVIITLSKDQVMTLAVRCIQKRGDLEGVDMRTSAALKSRCLCVFSDNCDSIVFVKRQNTLIFEEYCALFLCLSGQLVIRLLVPFGVFAPVGFETVYPPEDPFDCSVHNGLGEAAAFYRIYDFPVVMTV